MMRLFSKSPSTDKTHSFRVNETPPGGLFHATPQAPSREVKLVPAAFQAGMTVKIEGPIKVKNMKEVLGFISCMAVADALHERTDLRRLTPYASTHLKNELLGLSTLHQKNNSKYIDLVHSTMTAKAYTPTSVIEHITPECKSVVSRAWDMTTKEGLVAVISYHLHLEIKPTRHQFRDKMRSDAFACCIPPDPRDVIVLTSIFQNQNPNVHFDTESAAATVMKQLKTFKTKKSGTAISFEDYLPSSAWGIPHGTGVVATRRPRNVDPPGAGHSQQ